MDYSMVVSQEIVDYLKKFYDLGAFEQDANGALSVNAQVLEAFEAAHAVLAGGTVSIQITGGDAGKVAELEDLRKKAIDSVKDLGPSGGDAPLSP